MLSALDGFETLGGVDDAAECRHAVDSDILELVTVAVVRRLMRHARIERIAQCRISNELRKDIDSHRSAWGLAGRCFRGPSYDRHSFGSPASVCGRLAITNSDYRPQSPKCSAVLGTNYRSF